MAKPLLESDLIQVQLGLLRLPLSPLPGHELRITAQALLHHGTAGPMPLSVLFCGVVPALKPALLAETGPPRLVWVRSLAVTDAP